MRNRFLHHFVILLALLSVTIATPAGLHAQDADAGKPLPKNPFPNASPAPSLDGGVKWLNCGGPIDLKDLRGKVVLIDFWTFCCINCIHVLPDLAVLEEKYDRELVVIGVHSAKFENEKDSDAIREAILRYEISHPVVNDANMTIWRKFQVNSWPTLVLIDPEGNYCGFVSGEGNFEILDTKISELVKYHAAKGTLDRTVVDFALARENVEPTPLRYPGKVLADSDSDRLYISDSNHNRIVITTLDGKLVDIVGSGKIGSADGAFGAAEFDHPQGMALADGILYVADTENHLIRTVDLQKKTVSTLAGTGEQANFRAGGGPLKTTALNSPWDLLVHKGVLYIAMAGPHQIWAHPLGGEKIGIFAGTGREDIIDAPHKASAFAQPSGLATDGKALFVCDSEGSAIRRVPFDRSQPVTTIAGTSDLPGGRSLFEFGDEDGVGGQARLQHPLGAVFHNDKLFIADSYNHKIKQIVGTPSGEGKVTTLYGDGEAGDGLEPLELAEPAGLDIARNRLYIADTNNHRIVTVDLVSGEASLLKIPDLVPPPKPKVDDAPKLAAGAAAKAPSQTIKPSSSIPVTIEVSLPDGFKLNPDYPIAATATGTGRLVASDEQPARLSATGEKSTIQLKLPMTGQKGRDTLQISVRYGYCRDGESGVCKVGTVHWSLPVVAAADGGESIHLVASQDRKAPADESRKLELD